MLRTLSMFLTPALLSLLLLFIFYKSKTFKRLFILSYFIISITFLLANVLSGKLNRPIQLSYNLKISEIPQLNLIDEEGNPFLFDSSKLYVITFFYSRCQASCPLQIELVKKFSKRFSNYNFILISFDPKDKKGDLYELKIKYTLGENVKLLKGEGEEFREFLFDLGFPRDFEGDIINHPVIFLFVRVIGFSVQCSK
jgi:hypothetical protein